MRDIDSWLEINHFEKYKSAFDEHDIDLEVLAELSNEDLKELGVTLGHRRKMQKLLAAAQRVAPDDPLIHADIATVASSAAEHRHLSVLFCDLADSTALSARLDVEVYRDLILGYQQACTLAIEAFGGYVARVFGDGILAYFGYPQAHEDDGERAARAALAALSAVSELPTPAQHVQLAVRIGIATGPVVVGDIVGAGASQESVVLGEVPNLAARLQSMAIPGAIVISASTRHLLGNGFAFADLGRHELKGLDGAVPVWQLLRALDNTSRFERTRGAAVTQMVGRDEELAILNKRWQHSQASEGQVVFLSGEAGIGKSCMLNAFRTQLEVGSYTPVSYQCSPFHSSTALHPIIVQLRHAADIRADDSAQSMLAKLRQVIRRSANAVDGSVLVLAELADIPLHGELVSGNKSAAQRKDQTLQALLGQLHELQVERPVLLVFEDVHWIDPTTAELIDLCVRWVCSKRVLMLITHRPEYHGSWDGEAHVTTLSLRKLSRSVSSILINSVVGNVGLPAELMQEIVDKTDGIPLFVEELTKTIIESDMVQRRGDGYVLSRSLEAISIPSTLQASLTARLDRLGDAKQIAQIGAVIGREFDHALLADCCERDLATLESNLCALEDAGLISRRGSAPHSTYIFKHALVQDSAYESLLSSRRAQIHQGVASSLEAQARSASEAPAEVIAHHLHRAGDLDRAVTYWHLAANKAISRSAMREAHTHISQATHVLVTLPPTNERRRLLLDLLIAKITPILAVESYSSPALELLYQQAMPLFEALEDTPNIFPLFYARWAFLFTSGRVTPSLEQGRELIEVARRQALPLMEAVGNRITGVSLVWNGAPSVGTRHLDAALQVYDEQASDEIGFRFGQDGLAAMQTYQAIGLCSLGQIKRGVACAAAALDRADQLGHALTTAYTHGHIGLLYAALGDSQGLARCIHANERALAQEPIPVFETAGLRGIAALFEGHPQTACELLQRAIDEHSAIGFHLWHALWCAYLASSQLALGCSDKAMAAVEQGLEYVENDTGRWCEAELLRVRVAVLIANNAAEDEIVDGFARALDVARSQPNRIFELRAASDFMHFAGRGRHALLAAQQLRRALASISEPADIAVFRQANKLAEDSGA